VSPTLARQSVPLRFKENVGAPILFHKKTDCEAEIYPHLHSPMMLGPDGKLSLGGSGQPPDALVLHHAIGSCSLPNHDSGDGGLSPGVQVAGWGLGD
jgi:hypothetical protein